jgi:hypothetical protein
MKKYFLSVFALILTLPQLIVAQGYIATYTINVSNVPEYAKEMDNLMASEWGQDFPGYVSLTHYAFNGYDDATHAVIINYENADQMAEGTEMFYKPAFGAFLAKTSSYTEAVEQSLHLKLISGGEPDPEKNNVYTVYRMKVKDPSSYAKEYTKVSKAQEASGNMEGAYGLRAQVSGNNSYYSHYAFIGASDIKSAMNGQEQLYASDSFKKFSKAVAGNREIIQTSTIVVLATYE